MPSKAQAINLSKVRQGSEQLQALSEELGIVEVDHLAAAVSLAGRSIHASQRGSEMDALTLANAAEANLNRTGDAEFPGMLRNSATAIRLENLRGDLQETVGLLLREKYSDAEQSLKGNLLKIPEIARSFERESGFSSLTLPSVSRGKAG